MSKRQNQKRDDDETTGSASKRARITPGTNSTTENPPASCGLKNTLHGNVFQLKLLMLFLLRGIGSGFQFRLGTEIPGMGGKFDDLIFKFKNVRNNNEATSSDEQTESYRFLQAKHKQNEDKEKITAADLLKENDGEFSLPKYFRSYCRDIIKGTEGILPENVHDCIICTNIGFDSEEKLKNSGIILIRQNGKDEVLTFDKVPNLKKIPTLYKLRKTDDLSRIMAEWSEVHLLAKTLLDYVTDKKQLTLSSPIFKSYHVALVEEKVMEKGEGKLCASFLEGDNSRFREILSELTFVKYWEKLSFKSENKKTIRVDGTKKLILFDGTSIEKHLPKYSTTMEFDFRVFQDYYKDLVTEKVIVPEWRTKKKKPLTKEFIRGINQTQEGLQFRKKLCNAVFIHYWKDLTIQVSGNFGIKPSDYSDTKSLENFAGDEEIGDFLDKLVFAVHTPNEVELDDILKNEVGNYYNLHENDFQSDFILRKMLDWFKEKDSKFMSSEEGKNIFKEGQKKLKSLRVTAISIDYQNQLKEVLEFNDKAIEEIKGKLTQLLTSPDRIRRIATSLPKRTAVKVIAALEMLRKEKTVTYHTRMMQEYFQYEDSYLVTSSSRLQKDRSKFKKTLKSEHSHNLLVVACEDGRSTENEDEFYQKLVGKMLNKRIIIISQSKDEVEDKLNFGDLSEESKRALLEKQIDFQGKTRSVGDLIKRGDTTLDDLIENGDADEVIDSNSTEELLIEKGKILIRTCSSARFEPELYVERQMKHPWENNFYKELAEGMKCTTDELQKECTVDSQGCIHWLNVEEDRKEEIWERMKNIVEKRGQNSRDLQLSKGIVIEEKNLIDNDENRKGQVFIISDFAGTGKSTILFNYYERIKRDNPDMLVIRIDLVDYSKELAEFNFSRDFQSSAVRFFVEIFARSSSFTHSLLTHRFQTDGRIVVMLDGYDEIDGKLHEKVFQLMNAVTLTKMDALYITTRSHLKETLQDKCFQFSYTFKNFSQEDQVDCLSKYWGNNLKMSQTQDGPIQLFSKSLVERLTTTLNDRESDFVGIPLQCRMLAECFESQLQDTIQQGLPIATLIKSISENDLNLTSLYSLLMEKKLEIYRAEKFKADPHNHHANLLIDEKMKNLERYLRKLAIKTIAVYPKYVNVFWGHSNPFQTNNEICQEEKDFTSGGVCFGFLDKTDKGEVKFLHRTYAEYLFAKYLYAGFLPEDNENYNKLLESKRARKMIFSKIFVKEPYGGVRVFFNSMLNECVPMAHLSREIKQSEYILGVAIGNKNANIFMFMCDCLDLALDKVKIRRILSSNMFDPICDDPFFYDELSSSMYEQNSKVFERFISYYGEDADQMEVQRILNEMLYQPLIWMKDSELNKEEIKKILELVLGFLGRSQEALRQISGPNFKDEMKHIFKVFICNEYYDNLLENLLVLLSSAYSNDTLFTHFLADTVRIHHRNISHGNLEKTLRILRELGRDEVLKGISRQILKMDIQLFKRFYSLREEGESTEKIPFPANIQSLLVRDSHGMTRLHRAALNDDEETVDQILETVRISFLSNETEAKNLGKEMLHNVIASDEKGETPLYVAAACERENLCQKMLNFLKEMLPEDELRKYLKDTNGFFSNALWDAMQWKKIKMFRIILESTKTIFGQDYLIDLLKAQTPGENRHMFSVCDDKILFDIVVENIIIIDDEKSYNHLKDLLFRNKKFTVYNQLHHLDEKIFQKMSSMNRLDDWIKFLLDCALQKGKELEFCNLLEKITAHPQLFGMVFLVESDTESYLDKWFDFKFKPNNENIWNEDYVCLKRILKCLSENLGQSAIKELLVRDDYNIAIINSALLFGGKSLVDVMLTFLPNQKDEITKQLVNDIPNLIQKLICCCNQPNNRCWFPNILNFVFDSVEDCDLSKIIDLILDKCIINDDSPSRKRSIWSDYLDRNHNCAENVPEKIDKFLKCVSEKLGQSAVEKLVVEHDDGQVITQFLRRIGDEKLVNALLRHLSKERREDMERKLVLDAPTTIKQFTITDPQYCWTYWMGILHLKYVIRYADSVVLQQLIEIITQPYKSHPARDETTSIWSSYLFFSDCSLDRPENVDKFLLCVSDKLGKNKVKELVLHSWYHYGALQSVITSAASYGETDLVEVMLAHLTEEDRQEIQRDHVDTAVEPDAESLTSNDSTDEEIAS